MNINANTTDRQIAVRAAAAYYPNGAKPALCERLCATVEHLSRQPEGGWPETRQAWQQARESFDLLDQDMVHSIMRQWTDMREQRDALRQAQRQAALSTELAQCKPLVERVVAASTAAGEQPDHPEFFVSVIRQSYPNFSRELASAVSAQAVARMTGCGYPV